MVFFRRKPAAEQATHAAKSETPAAAPTKAEIAAAVAAHSEGTPAAAMSAELPPHPLPGEAGQFAPMFVKVDKYREIITELGELKTFLANIKQVFSVLSDLEATREDAIKVMRAALQRMERAVSSIDSEMLRPIGFEAFPHGEVEVKHIESSLTALQQQLAALRRQLEEFQA